MSGMLTPRELAIVTLLRTGKSNKEIARVLKITHGTVKVHLHSVFAKLEVQTRMQLVARYPNLIGE